MMATEKKGRVHMRWTIKRDLPAAAAINAAAGGSWDEAALGAALKNRDTIGMVAALRDQIEAFVVYQLQTEQLVVLALVGSLAGRAELLGHTIGKFENYRPRRNGIAVPFADLAGVAGTGLGSDYRTENHLPKVRATDLPAIAPQWRTTTVRALCAGRKAPYLPVLADALEDAGCDNVTLLGALRADGPAALCIYRSLRAELVGV